MSIRGIRHGRACCCTESNVVFIVRSPHHHRAHQYSRPLVDGHHCNADTTMPILHVFRCTPGYSFIGYYSTGSVMGPRGAMGHVLTVAFSSNNLTSPARRVFHPCMQGGVYGMSLDEPRTESLPPLRWPPDHNTPSCQSASAHVSPHHHIG